MLLIILLIILLGGGGLFGYSIGYYGRGGVSMIGLLILILMLWALFGGGVRW